MKNSIRGDLLRVAFAVALAALLGVFASYVIGIPGEYPDFAVLWGAHQTAHPYDPEVLGARLNELLGRQLGPYAYPPTFLWLTEPLGWVSLSTAYIGLAAVTAFALALWGSRLNPLLLLAPVAFGALINGQPSVLLGLALYAALTLLDRRPARSGALIGIAVCVKPQLAIFVPLGLLLAGRFRVVGWSAATAFVLCLLATAAYGPEVWSRWLGSLPAFVAAQAPWPPMSQTAPLWLRIALLPLAVAGFVLAFRSGDAPAQLITAGTLALLISPYARYYDVALLAPAALALVGQNWRAVPALAFLLLPGSFWTLGLALVAVLPLRYVARIDHERLHPLASDGSASDRGSMTKRVVEKPAPPV